MSLRSPLGRVLGRGSAKSGVSHWWAQRVTAVALVPLTVWFAFSVVHLPTSDHEAVRAWVGSGIHPVLLLLLIGTLTWHSALGVQVVLEDYVHAKGLKVASLLASTFAHLLLAAAGAYAVLRIAFTTGSA
ncbi:MAG: succinate dehydrogenase, hydrophobic membrane anchor protein [Gammaproteobacteria bacterium]|nr:succinate dehydrogenase, hydrophobic membrane anchor protein [Gammaproteobacteria bacterium]